MAKQIRVTFNDQTQIVEVEGSLDGGKWVKADKKVSRNDGGTAEAAGEGGCGAGTANCGPIPNRFVMEFFGDCYYFPC